jgi:hypothetical protein
MAILDQPFHHEWTARVQALTSIKTSEVAISFYPESGAGPSPINGHALATTAGNAATATSFPYAALAGFPSASIRGPRGGIGTKNSQNRNP